MKMLANVQYIIVPSRLNEYPSGSTKLEIRDDAPKRLRPSSVFGYAASELAVENAIISGSRISRSR